MYARHVLVLLLLLIPVVPMANASDLEDAQNIGQRLVSIADAVQVLSIKIHGQQITLAVIQDEMIQETVIIHDITNAIVKQSQLQGQIEYVLHTPYLDAARRFHYIPGTPSLGATLILNGAWGNDSIIVQEVVEHGTVQGAPVLDTDAPTATFNGKSRIEVYNLPGATKENFASVFDTWAAQVQTKHPLVHEVLRYDRHGGVLFTRVYGTTVMEASYPIDAFWSVTR